MEFAQAYKKICVSSILIISSNLSSSIFILFLALIISLRNKFTTEFTLLGRVCPLCPAFGKTNECLFKKRLHQCFKASYDLSSPNSGFKNINYPIIAQTVKDNPNFLLY